MTCPSSKQMGHACILPPVATAAALGPDYEVAVVGAGFSGIGAGIRLKEAGIHSFVILEQASDLGGTWRDNVYPGIAVDIASFTYSFSFEQNPYWSRVFAPGCELKAYADHCADKYGLRPHMRFGVRVLRAMFDPQRHLWMIDAEGKEPITARFIISATGGLTQPKLPDIPGLASFRGRTIHTARWDPNCDLAGKRVAVIGTGATAVQLVPAISARVSSLYVFQRTPIWIVPKPDAEIPDWLQWTFGRFPAVQRVIRWSTSLATETVMVFGVVYHRQTPRLVRRIERMCREHLDQQVEDPALREKLRPRYGFGCKRPSFSNDYLRTFNQEQVELVTEPIEKITATGIRCRDGSRRRIDVLILATGFKVFEPGNTPPYQVYGLNGRELGAFWDEERYQAYEGATVPGFPNLFLTLGPYAATGASWFSMVEAQVNHALRCIVTARARKATYVEIRKEPHDGYFQSVLRRQRNTVFYNNGCAGAHSYYFDRHGDAPFIRPSSGIEMWWRSQHFPLDHYRFER